MRQRRCGEEMEYFEGLLIVSDDREADVVCFHLETLSEEQGNE